MSQPSVIIDDDFFDFHSRLTGNETARVVAFLQKFRQNPAHPGISLHPVDKTKADNLWSARITQDLRAILYKDGDTWAVLYADHHDDAYAWAERRTIGRHPTSGSFQIVEIPEVVREEEPEVVPQPVYQVPAMFADHADDYLLSLGVPENWLPTIREIRTEDQLIRVGVKLPTAVADRLIALSCGELVTPPPPVAPEQPITESPDTHRDFFVVESEADLNAILNAPMERWIAFLHPSQRELVEGSYSGPAKVSGSAGTGKTVVAMHRARFLARRGERVLLTSFVRTLCENLERNLALFCTPAELENITVSTVHHQALTLLQTVNPVMEPIANQPLEKLLDRHRLRNAPEYPKDFVQNEWDQVIRMQGISTWPEYRRAQRTGRGVGLSIKERKRLWRVFEDVMADLISRDALDWPGMCIEARKLLDAGEVRSPYTAVIVDEVQDLKPPDLRFLQALCRDNPGNLMVCGDTGQRIYPGGFSLSSLGIEVRGRSRILRINYRTTRQIRVFADTLLGMESDDMDGGVESRTAVRSLRTGPSPMLRGYPSRADEETALVESLRQRIAGGMRPDAIGVFARTNSEVKKIGELLEAASLPWREMSDSDAPATPAIMVGTMYRAKGLEFKAVFIGNCSDGAFPSTSILGRIEDPVEKEAALQRMKRLLYVTMTRARDELTISWTGKPSAFLKDLFESQEGTANDL